MSPQTIVSVITAAAHACEISPKAVQHDPNAVDTYEILVARRCVIVQLSHLGIPDAHIRAALRLSELEFLRSSRIGSQLRHQFPDCRIHSEIADSVPGALKVPCTVLPMPAIITAAAQIGSLSERQITKSRESNAARDYRSAALLIAIAQGSSQEEILATFGLSSTTGRLTMTKNARSLSTVDLRFSKILSAIHLRAIAITRNLQPA